MTKQQAIELAAKFLKAEDYVHCESNCSISARLVTRETLIDLSERYSDIRQRRPETWRKLLAIHHDYWEIVFQSKGGEIVPDKISVRVEVETGEVCFPDSL